LEDFLISECIPINLVRQREKDLILIPKDVFDYCGDISLKKVSDDQV